MNVTHTTLNGDSNGYFEISIEDFSYDLGPIVVRETKPPTGYTPIGDIEIGYIDSQNTVGILSGNSELIQYTNGILIVICTQNPGHIEFLTKHNKSWMFPCILQGASILFSLESLYYYNNLYIRLQQ